MNPGILTPPTQFATMPRGLLGNPQPTPMPDAKLGRDFDAQRYIDGVERADGQILEDAVRSAINDFVVGCKIDRTWHAIRASCILMGARTLSGALVPLAGTAPTNVNFVSGDYNRRTGLVGNGSTKYLNSNRGIFADSLNDMHMSVWLGAAQQTNANTAYIGNGSNTTGASGLYWVGGISQQSRCRSAALHNTFIAQNYTGFYGISRAASTAYTNRISGADVTFSAASETSSSTANTFVFARSGNTGLPEIYSDARLAFYSIGSSVSLSSLDSRLTTLYRAIGAAIP